MTRIALLTAALLAGFCSFASATDSLTSPLYTRLGGRASIDAVVSDAVDAAASAGLAVTADRAATKRRFAQFICARTGGGCSSDLAGAEFRTLVEPLRIALRAHQVPLAACNELIEVLAPT